MGAHDRPAQVPALLLPGPPEPHQDSRALRILLVEDDPKDVELIRSALARHSFPPVRLFQAGMLADAFKVLETARIDAVILDLLLPDASGLDAVRQMHAAARDVPILVLTGQYDDQQAVLAVCAGAQDFLTKNDFTGQLLFRSLRHAIERHRLHTALYQLAVMDEQTGLYNRRGFFSLADHHIKMAQRDNKAFWLILADLDFLKQINDSCGHHVGDVALIEAAVALKETFRVSDVLGRVGGDEFAVLALDSSKNALTLFRKRLRARLAMLNGQDKRSFRLSLSTGGELYDPQQPCSIEEFYERADVRLYEEKRTRETLNAL